MSESVLRELSSPVVTIVGPTASGKTALAQSVALRINAEIVSADSMQVYQGMNIGTGKIPPEEQKVFHYGIDLCKPNEPYSAALFQSYARNSFQEIAAKGKHIVLCGGTGLYIRAALDDYTFPKGEQTDNPTRIRYTSFAEQKGAQALWDILYQRDPESALLIHPHNVRRVVRAFEMLEDNHSYAEQHKEYHQIKQVVPACFIGLEVTPAVLNKRIDDRVEYMVETGLIDEVKGLLEDGFRESITAPQAIGYKEIVAFLEGELSLEEALQKIKIRTHRYAKRQRTWFRKDARITWLHADLGDTEALLHQVLPLLATIES